MAGEQKRIDTLRAKWIGEAVGTAKPQQRTAEKPQLLTQVCTPPPRLKLIQKKKKIVVVLPVSV